MTSKKHLTTTGLDVLAIAAKKAGLSPLELNSVRAWLAEQLVAQEFAKLGQGGHTNTQVPLRQVFVDLPVSENPGAPQRPESRTLFLSKLLSSKPLNLQQAFRSRSEVASASHISDMTEDTQEEDQQELFNVPRDYRSERVRFDATLLIGGPGQGKSTIGQLACQLHRAALIRPVSTTLPSTQRNLVETLSREQEPVGPGERPLAIPKNPLLPLQITLPEFVAWVATSDSGVLNRRIPTLLRYLANLPSAKSAGLNEETLFELICAMPSLLVLDGFDEVGATPDRTRIVHASRELLIALSERAASSQILATTRPQGYADELMQIGVRLQKVFLAPLLKHEALAYAKKLIEAKISGADQQAKAQRQVSEAANEPATERLLTTPLQVTILTALVQQLGRAPRERWNLFSRYFAYTFDREIERDTYASALLAEHRAHVERIHSRVALLLQVEAERDGGASARMTREVFESVISEVLAEDEFAKDRRKGLVREIANAAENRLVFLVEPEPGRFGFEIRSLQEFMAAWALTSGRDSEVEARFIQISKAPMFRNVALFISSRLFSEGSPLRDVLASEICKGLDEDDNDELASLTRVGALLALETLEEGASLSQPKRARALMDRAVRLLELPPGHEHIRLARAANVDTTPVLRDALERCLSIADSESSYCAATAWLCIVDAVNRKQGWATELGNKYWKVASAARNLFDAMTRAHVPLGEWICGKIEEQAAGIDPIVFIGGLVLHADEYLTPSWPLWLTAVFGPMGSQRNRTEGGFISLATVAAPRTTVPAPNGDVPQSGIWAAWIAAATFECDPNAQSLATALEKLASGPSIDYWKRVAWRASWPLAVCINSADKISDLKVFARMLRTLSLGDTSEWVEAERAWAKNHNVTAILDSAAKSRLWTIESLGVAPPLMGVPHWRLLPEMVPRSKNNSGTELVRKANQLFLKTRSLSIRRRASEICLAHWRNLRPKQSSKFDPINWVRSSPESAALLVPRPEFLPIDAWKALLDAGDPAEMFPWALDIAGITRSLRELPMHPVLLKLAARTVSFYADHYSILEQSLDEISFAVQQLFELPENSAVPGVDFAVLKIFAGSYPSTQDDVLLSSLTNAAAGEASVYPGALGALRTSRLPRERANRLLARIYRVMGVNNASSYEAIKDMRDALQQRTSDLDSQSTWDRLALPLPYPWQALQKKLDGRIPSQPVRISQIQLQDIGPIKRLSLDLKAPTDGRGQWTVIIGPNGSGKSTLLRSLALALRSVKHPAIWPRGAFSNSWQRFSETGDEVLSSYVQVTLGDGVEHRTLIRASAHMSITQLPEQDQPRLFPIFAFGCRRGSVLGGSARQVYLGEDDGPEIATLFDEGADLIQAETWLVSLEGDILRNPRSKVIYDSVLLGLKALLMVDSIEVSSQRLWISEAGRGRLPLSCLSDGYLTNAGWFLDLVARWLDLAEKCDYEVTPDFLSRMRGLVLIDEIDLHLHPQWQVEIISRTRSLMPEMSFVVTTHNPLTLVGASADEIWILERKPDGITAQSGVEAPMLMTGGQIYRQYFGIVDIYPNEFGRLLQRYSYLSGYGLRDDSEDAELLELGRRLSDVGINPGWEVVPRVRGDAGEIIGLGRESNGESP